MSAPDANSQIQEAVRLIQAGQTEEARILLADVVAADPQNESAWLWLATVTADRQQRLEYLERVLAINPDNATARQAVAQLTGTPSSDGETQPPDLPDQPPQPMSTRLRYFYLISVVGVLSVILIVVALSLRNEQDNESAEPTATVRAIIPGDTATPTLNISPTPSLSPWPTVTEGPSPTPPTLPATWTPVPTATDAPTRTPRPTWTPRPTQTPVPTAIPATATDMPAPPTFTPATTITDAATPSPTAFATASGTPQAASTTGDSSVAPAA